nr:hypothetical protein [Sphingobium yanoikuyae]
MHAILGHDTHGTDTVRAIVEQQAEIILVRRAACARLTPAQPALGPQMLEKRYQAATPEMLARSDRQGAGDFLPPPLIIDKTAVRPQLTENASLLAFEGHDCATIRDVEFLKFFRPSHLSH